MRCTTVIIQVFLCYGDSVRRTTVIIYIFLFYGDSVRRTTVIIAFMNESLHPMMGTHRKEEILFSQIAPFNIKVRWTGKERIQNQ